MSNNAAATNCVKVYGVRHHGPGSSQNIISALDSQNPDIILIEGPSDANGLIQHLDPSEFLPPVALLLYDSKNTKNAAFYPFASFSPEWQALVWATKHKKEKLFIDIPQGINFSIDLDESFVTPSTNNLVKDPLGTLATAQGYRDIESWWESHFETLISEDIFTEISLLIREMRESMPHVDHFNTLREAYMREQIRLNYKNGYKNIAVVCGAWHSPALEDVDKIPAHDDKALLKELTKVKMSALWIPWSYKRLAKQMGYGAGISAPMWYDILFHHPEDATYHWMAYVAHELRKMGYEIAPSLSIDASRLSNQLAIMRKMQKASFEELTDAALSVFAYTNEDIIREIQKDILIGDRIGHIPSNASKHPIQMDFDNQIKSFRLSQDIDKNTPTEKKLDLRKENHRNTSSFFHRLILINLPWAEKHDEPGLGTFREVWTLRWDVEYHFRIIDAGAFGLTIEQAAINKTKADIARKSLPELIQLLQICLDADLKTLTSDLIIQIDTLVNTCHDTLLLLKTFNSISSILLSGHARLYDERFLEELRQDILLYISIRIRDEVNQLTPEKSMEVYRDVLMADRYVQHIDKKDLIQKWNSEIQRISIHCHLVNAIHGACFRLGIDRNQLNQEQVKSIFSLIFSNVQSLDASSIWLHGFLQDNFLILLYNEDLWNALKIWINNLSQDAFVHVLPLLRKSFSVCEDNIKAKLFQAISGKEETPTLERSELPDDIQRTLASWFSD